jgi:hypothetical protein
MESTVLREEPDSLDADNLKEEEAEAKTEAERHRPGLAIFTDGVTAEQPHGVQLGGLRRGVCRPARALETAARRQTTPERVTIVADAQAVIKRMASEEPDIVYAIRKFGMNEDPNVFRFAHH